ncbi:MAG: hypothetical protein ABI268_03400 [Rhodanobacter sp.]
MKLLRDFFLRHMAGLRTVSGRAQSARPALRITVPAPLAAAIRQQPVLVELSHARAEVATRREPVSLLSASHDRRVGTRR